MINGYHVTATPVDKPTIFMPDGASVRIDPSDLPHFLVAMSMTDEVNVIHFHGPKDYCMRFVNSIRVEEKGKYGVNNILTITVEGEEV